jgi:hypothetical protein
LRFRSGKKLANSPIQYGTQLRTPLRELELANNAHAVITTYPLTPAPKVPTVTAPISTGNQLVWQSEGLNLMKIIPFQNVSGGGNTYTGLTAKIIGWNITTDGLTKLYVPQQIADISIVPSIATATFTLTTPGASIQTFQNTQECSVNFGDAKLFNSDSVSGKETPAWLVIDTAGCALISMSWFSSVVAGSPKANAFWSSL